MSTTNINTDQAVKERYSAASKEREASLCCPVVYDQKYLEVIPQEVIDRDYGCGDPSPYVRTGDTVLDLGAGGGKLCFIISQQVGESGKVIGVDFNPDMLELARRSQKEVAAKIGYDNIEFRCGRIQDLAIDLEAFADKLNEIKVDSAERALDVLELTRQVRGQEPMIPDNSVDCVVSNCVLNLVRDEDRRQLFSEIFRVLKPGGRAAISDIVSDEIVPDEMRNDGELWSGCISGAWKEDHFIDEFVSAGFDGVTLDKWQQEPWQTVNGIEFRSVTVVAQKPFLETCYERNQAVIYKGPFDQVKFDDGHIYARGQRTAVCDRTFKYLQLEPYKDLFFFVEPLKSVPEDQLVEFDCSKPNRLRHPRETKGELYNLTIAGEDSCCGGSTDCC